MTEQTEQAEQAEQAERRTPQRILLTGGSSMLGAAVARSLTERGDRVTVLQRRPAGLGLPEVLADLTDREAVRGAVRGQDAVIHLAAKVGVAGTWPQYLRTNVTGTGTVVTACRDLGVRRLIHISSPAVAHAGAALVGVGAGPADPVHARGHYARSKAMAELIALATDGPGMNVLAIRPHLVWGPGDTQLVGRIVERSRRGSLPVLGTGAALVDSTYVDNAVDAIVAALDRVDQVHGRALVVSNGEPRPVGELIGCLVRAGGAPPPTRRVPPAVGLLAGAAVEVVWATRRAVGRPAAGDPPMTRFLAEQLSTAHWFDQRLTRQLLGWHPRVDLAAGFARLAASYAVSLPLTSCQSTPVRDHPGGGSDARPLRQCRGRGGGPPTREGVHDRV